MNAWIGLRQSERLMAAGTPGIEFLINEESKMFATCLIHGSMRNGIPQFSRMP